MILLVIYYIRMRLQKRINGLCFDLYEIISLIENVFGGGRCFFFNFYFIDITDILLPI